MKSAYIVGVGVLAVFLADCSDNNNNNNNGGGSSAVPASVQGLQGDHYSISVFATAPTGLRPDDMVELSGSVYVVFQDPNVNPDGTFKSGTTSSAAEVIQYDLKGNVQATYPVPGHPDGIAVVGSVLWVSSNEDANTVISVLTPGNAKVQQYTYDQAPTAMPHGGGLDDMKVVNNVVYASASNPITGPSTSGVSYSTDSSGATAQYGVNTGPALYAVSLNSDGKTFHAAVALNSGTPATLQPGGTAVTLNMTDTDSSAIDPAGDLVVDSQQDSELVFVSNPGASTPTVNVLPVTLYGNPWPLDDTRWSPASGSSFMLLSDNPGQLIYRIDASGGFPASTAYSAGQGTVLQLDTSKGVLTPIYVGMNNPHGLIFVQ